MRRGSDRGGRRWISEALAAPYGPDIACRAVRPEIDAPLIRDVAGARPVMCARA